MKMIRIKKRKPNRSFVGDIGIYILLILFGVFFALPLIYAISNAFKPLDEIFRFPPRFFVRNPTLNNFRDLFIIMSSSYVPFSRYIFNSLFTTFGGTAGHLIAASMGAYVLAKYDFPGGKTFFNLVVTALMFSVYVTQIPTYLILTRLGWVDTYLAVIIPSFAMPMGLFLMKQFMETIPDSLIEAAKIDGAKEGRIFVRIVMPMVKPAWLTVIVFSVQTIWNNKTSAFIYSESLKPLPYAMQQIYTGGVARQGAGSAVTLFLMSVPIIVFLACESNVLETMASSGIKD